ncbi:DUF4142 domain-containing protein [Mucilaginibacter corticis]|uniref:DUF4142 domain-containing protein n=1 Tax=Mucilaginibacter corticis TaxID=2597670 RepID=A0A556MV46_9SPHI|nr:DUF4142 domain-containing protein [Mucilaginibacter corticis]TSJ43722.1 DUF4142 domain-containing protein [Mucilaginibacter corticis]
MKKVTLLLLTLFAVCVLQACHGHSDNADTDDDTTTDVVDTANNATIIVGKDDAKFVTTIAQACLAEIKIGTMAKQKGKDKRIKNFGAMMVKDLTKGKGRLIALAKAKKITLPDSISMEAQQSIADLDKKDGKDFDAAYLDKTREDYKRALDLFTTTSKTAYDPQIKAFATHNILTIQRHLDLIDAIDGSMK